MNSSQKFAIAFQECVGAGDIYTDAINSKNWVIELDNHTFSESGQGIKGILIPYEEAPDISKETILKYCPLANEMYEKYTINNNRKIITTFVGMFPNYSEFTKFDGNGCVLFDRRLQKKFYLKILRSYTVSETISYVIAINRQLAGLGLAPPLHLSGHMGEYGYLVMEYLPITAQNAVEKGTFNKDVLTSAIMDLVNVIHGLQIYNLDVHWQNFLYDDEKNVLYMIDFDDAKLDLPQGYNLEKHRVRLLEQKF